MCSIFSPKEETMTDEFAHDKRLKRGEFIGIIIHHTDIGGRKEISDSKWAQLYKNIAAFLMKKDNIYVSAHYIIGRKGETKMLVNPETHEAFHAGKSSYWHPGLRRVVSDWNRYAIGIELVGDGNLHKYSVAQIESCAVLCGNLMTKYDIHPMAIVGHENIAPTRKVDPGKLFDWRMFFSLLYQYVR